MGSTQKATVGEPTEVEASIKADLPCQFVMNPTFWKTPNSIKESIRGRPRVAERRLLHYEVEDMQLEVTDPSLISQASPNSMPMASPSTAAFPSSRSW